MNDVVTVTEHDLPELARTVLGLCERVPQSRAAVVLLDGDLGAGKTTFTKALAEELAISDHVHSPTFILKKEYRGNHARFTKLVHIDAYRFGNPKEGKALRLDDDLASAETIICIEWPTKMHAPQADVMMNFTVIDDDTREITLTYEN